VGITHDAFLCESKVQWQLQRGYEHRGACSADLLPSLPMYMRTVNMLIISCCGVCWLACCGFNITGVWTEMVEFLCMCSTILTSLARGVVLTSLARGVVLTS
jgi:hypothetical protein